MEAEHDGTGCAKYEALLEDLVDGKLDGAEATSLANHMKDCAGCRSAFKDAATAARLLRLAEPTADPGPGFAHLVMTRIRAQAALESKSIWQPFVTLAWKFAATAAMGLAVLVAFDVVGQQTLQNDSRDLLSASSANPPRTADDVLILMAESNHGQR